MMADKWIINNTYLQNFNTGKNTITLNFSGGISYISGGYLRVGYKTIARPYTASNMTFWLPGINGIINLYSAFYVPGNITGMNISLHYFSNYSIMMMIGNKTVFEDDNATGESYADVTNETLYSILKYDELSMKSVPIRLGLKQIANISTDTGNADVVLITDLSGSMNWRLNSDNNGNTVTNCSSPSLYLSTTKRISLAKCLDKNFVAIVLNTTGNRIALVGFARDANTYYRGLTDNLSLVTADINSYPNSPSGGTCICCAINRAFNIIGSRNASRQRFIIVMSDGIPTYKCVNNGDCTNGPYEGNLTTGYPLWACCGGGEDNCDDNQCWQSTGSANYSVRRAATELDAEVDSIGFGPVKSCAFANATLRGIAEIGNGTYSSSSNSSELDEIYAKLAKHIVSLSYVEQTANITGKLLPSVLYPDSYIHFNYNPSVAEIEFNRIPITVESMPAGNNISEVRVYIPPDSLVISAKATSYSANKWTANVSVSNIAGVTTAYLLSEYGKSFVPLGDPFTVDIPGSLFVSGVNNTVTTITGVNPKNLTGGSVDNRLIYTMLLTGSVDYDRVFKRADGCRWRLDFEDGSNQTFNAPPLYNGSKSCYYINGGYDSGDAVDDAVYRLLSRLDVDGDGLVDVTIRGDQLAIEAFAIPNVPSLWGPGIVEVRVWAR
ncbi:TPA: VWA domain-containing protein [Candidatus Woesearchaeota archaeon]|nr:VWA domain-containing protein [Candidatus Woesearchaeota archaeon]